MFKFGTVLILGTVLLSASARAQTPVGSGFTYQGQLRSDDTPLDADTDLQFTLWDAATDGEQIGTLLQVDALPVIDGQFTVELDFGPSAFVGDARWLEVSVRSPAGSGPFTTLDPRQPLTATPYALHTRGVRVDDAENVEINGVRLDSEGQRRVTFLDDEAGLSFPSSVGDNAPMIHMFAAGSSNADRMVVAHSPGFSNWGLRYRDVGDVFEFVRVGVAVMAVDLFRQRVGINTNAPESALHVAGGVRARGGAPGGNGIFNNGYAFAGSNGDNDSGLFSVADGEVSIFTDAQERVRFSNAGMRFPDGSVQSTAYRGVRTSALVDFGQIPRGAQVSQTVVIPGAAVNGSVSISPSTNLPPGLGILFARVASPGLVQYHLRNFGGSTIDPPPFTVHVTVINP